MASHQQSPRAALLLVTLVAFVAGGYWLWENQRVWAVIAATAIVIGASVLVAHFVCFVVDGMGERAIAPCEVVAPNEYAYDDRSEVERCAMSLTN